MSFDPVTFASTASLGSSALSKLFGFFGQESQAEASRANANMQFAISLRNSELLRERAARERLAGEEMASQIGQQTREQVGVTKAVQAASGIDLGSKSYQEVVAGQENLGRRNMELTRRNAAERARAAESAAQQELMQGIFGLSNTQRSPSALGYGASFTSDLLGNRGLMEAAHSWYKGL